MMPVSGYVPNYCVLTLITYRHILQVKVIQAKEDESLSANVCQKSD